MRIRQFRYFTENLVDNTNIYNVEGENSLTPGLQFQKTRIALQFLFIPVAYLYLFCNLTTMYVYCVYPTMSKKSENLSDLSKKDRNKCHSSPFINVVKGVFFVVRVYVYCIFTMLKVLLSTAIPNIHDFKHLTVV
jgi:hypothetical protein